MSSSTNVTDVIAAAEYWRMTATGWNAVAHIANLRRYSPTGLEVCTALSDDALAQRHSLLPHLLRALAEYFCRLTGNAVTPETLMQTYLSGALVVGNLRQLESPRWVEDTQGDRRYIGSVRDFRYDSRDPHHAECAVMEYELCGVHVLQSSTANKYLPADMDCVIGYSPETLVLSTEWLDTTYPGWKARWDTASALGYSYSELANFVLQSVPQPAPAPLPEMSLD